MLDGERCQVSVRNQIRGDLRASEDLAEDFRMRVRRRGNPRLLMLEPLQDLLPRRANRQWTAENTGIRRDSKKRERRLPWDSDSEARVELLFEPPPRAKVLRKVGKLRV